MSKKWIESPLSVQIDGFPSPCVLLKIIFCLFASTKTFVFGYLKIKNGSGFEMRINSKWLFLL